MLNTVFHIKSQSAENLTPYTLKSSQICYHYIFAFFSQGDVISFLWAPGILKICF